MKFRPLGGLPVDDAGDVMSDDRSRMRVAEA